jgi:hypothetical protein
MRVMNGRTRDLLLAVTLVAIMTIATWVLYVVWRSQHPVDLAVYGAFAVPFVVAVSGLGVAVWHRRRRLRGDMVELEEVERLADALAVAVWAQWSRAAGDQGLLPKPIPVRWEQPAASLVGPVSVAITSTQFSPLPGLPVVSEHRLRRGLIGDLYSVYGGLGSGRLVIAGNSGSGKTGAAVLLVLEALRHREQMPEAKQRVPVPVMFTFDGWDPETQRVEDWLAGRLQQAYQLFAGKRGIAKARALLTTTDKVAVILDGLDEVSDDLRPIALNALSNQATFRLVLLTRTAQMAAVASRGLLEGAAAIELQEVDPATAADYLAQVQLYPAPAAWSELTRRLHDSMDSPLAQSLNSPLALTLIRGTYRTGDVQELLDFSDLADDATSQEAILDHLLDRVLPAAYARRPGETRRLYDLPEAQVALCYIAAQMSKEGTYDLQWWHIPKWKPRVPRIIVSSLALGLLAFFACWLFLGNYLWICAGLALLFGMSVGVPAGTGGTVPQCRVKMRRLMLR